MAVFCFPVLIIISRISLWNKETHDLIGFSYNVRMSWNTWLDVWLLSAVKLPLGSPFLVVSSSSQDWKMRPCRTSLLILCADILGVFGLFPMTTFLDTVYTEQDVCWNCVVEWQQEDCETHNQALPLLPGSVLGFSSVNCGSKYLTKLLGSFSAWCLVDTQ